MNTINQPPSKDDLPSIQKPSKHLIVEPGVTPGQSTHSTMAPQAKEALLLQLKQLRESKGLALQSVQQRLKFSPRWVESLEQGDWANLPQGASLRTFTKNYAKFLGLDAQVLYDALNIDVDADRSSMGRHTSVRAIGDQIDKSSSIFNSIIYVAIGLVIVVVLLAIIFKGGSLGADQLPDALKRLTQ